MSELRNPQAFESWFFQIVKTQSFRFLNKENKRKTEPMVEISENSNVEADALLKIEFEKAYSKLPLELQQVFLLAGIHQWTINEVAGFLGVPSGTVKSRLSRARQQLQSMISYNEDGRNSGEDRANSWESMLSQLRERRLVEQRQIKDTLSQTWATIKSVKFDLIRHWYSASGESTEQHAKYTWMSPNWWRIDTQSDEAGNVTTVIHGNRMRTWFESSNTINQIQLSRNPDPQFILEHLWRDLLSREDWVVLPSDTDELWHVWLPTHLAESSNDESEQAGVHFWIHPSDGIPRRIEYWWNDKCSLREEIAHVTCNPPVTRRSFDLPTDIPKSRLRSFSDLMGGLGTKVSISDALQQCPFTLMGLDDATLSSCGINKSVGIKKYYGEKEWAVRYGPPARSRELLRGSPVVTLWQAERLNDDVARHWGLSKLTEKQPDLSPTAKSEVVYTPSMVLSRLFWETNERPYMLTASGLSMEDLVNLAHQLKVIIDKG
ncbi:RNA polymerase sigma factor (sigma-70 family) [Alicyclobacillus sacchari]|uniref:RNA polymerase sigma factor (Sigma-70 family) n=1 Tax=Alicyclobacillus sacchari TaxID=392010 RepID=A0A4R8LN21_9BACL|nr:RNA polymerase sigma factor (sigma-70 family) [Alicyclobacillus sacchari]